jgi:hypothetical protein
MTTAGAQDGHSVSSIFHPYSVDFVDATQSVLFVMCGIMAFAGVVALFGLRRGLQEAQDSPAVAGAR